MSEPAQRRENHAIFKQNYTPELFIAFKMVYSCCFSLGGNLDLTRIPPKKNLTSTTGLWAPYVTVTFDEAIWLKNILHSRLPKLTSKRSMFL